MQSKNNDFISKNIEKYFNTELLKEGAQEDMELIEERILNENGSDTDDQIEVTLNSTFSLTA